MQANLRDMREICDETEPPRQTASGHVIDDYTGRVSRTPEYGLVVSRRLAYITINPVRLRN